MPDAREQLLDALDAGLEVLRVISSRSPAIETKRIEAINKLWDAKMLLS